MIRPIFFVLVGFDIFNICKGQIQNNCVQVYDLVKSVLIYLKFLINVSEIFILFMFYYHISLTVYVEKILIDFSTLLFFISTFKMIKHCHNGHNHFDIV